MSCWHHFSSFFYKSRVNVRWFQFIYLDWSCTNVIRLSHFHKKKNLHLFSKKQKIMHFGWSFCPEWLALAAYLLIMQQSWMNSQQSGAHEHLPFSCIHSYNTSILRKLKLMITFLQRWNVSTLHQFAFLHQEMTSTSVRSISSNSRFTSNHNSDRSHYEE